MQKRMSWSICLIASSSRTAPQQVDLAGEHHGWLKLVSDEALRGQVL